MKRRIFVVDEEAGIREVVAFVLERHGFVVEKVESGKQLYQRLIVELPDLIILGVSMPGEDGYTVFQALQRDPATRRIPVVMVSARVEDIYRRISHDQGIAEHLTKPFHPAVLVECVRGILGGVGDNSQDHSPTA